LISNYSLTQSTHHNGTVYLTTSGPQHTHVWALDESDGVPRFKTPFKSQREHRKAPVVAGSTIVTAGGLYGGTYGFDLATGAETFFLAGPQAVLWTPAAANGLVYVTGGGVRVIRPTDGNVVAELTDARLSSVTTPVLGSANNLLAIDGNRLVSVDLSSMKVSWEQSASYAGMPVVGGGVVFGYSGTGVAARRESDGALLWSWTPPAPDTEALSLVLTNNVLFASISPGFGDAGTTYAIDLASHLSVWSYPTSGELALSSEGVLYIVSGPKVVAISVR
jgi:outer membrane protein assembly factor BamB